MHLSVCFGSADRLPTAEEYKNIVWLIEAFIDDNSTVAADLKRLLIIIYKK